MKKNFWIVSISFMLFLSILLNIFLFFAAKEYYIISNKLRLAPFELHKTEAYKIPKDSLKQRVVFFGDSRAADWVSPSISDAVFFNLGIGGQTTTQVLERYKLQVKPIDINTLVLQVGINDLKMIPLIPEKKEAIIENCKNNISAIIDAALREKIKVIYTTIIPTAEVPFYRLPFWSAEVDYAIHEVNEFIIDKYQKIPEVTIFNTANILADKSGKVLDHYSRDFLHLSDNGYEALNEELVLIIL